MDVAGFDWDEGKWPKCAKHGVSRQEIESVFVNGPGVYADPDHSLSEQRLRAIGQTRSGRTALVAFTLREVAGEVRIRPVSARYMHAKEIRRYGFDA